MRIPTTTARRLAAVAVLGLAAWAPTAQAMEKDEARHLLARTGFGGTPAEIDQLLPLTREQAVDALIAGTHATTRTKPLEWCAGDYAAYMRARAADWDAAKGIADRSARDKKENELRGERDRRSRELKGWLYQEMITTDSPLTERMVLFWSNHFTSALRTIEEPRVMFEQDALIRRDALDNFAFFLKDINTDPAMYRYLDSDSNVSGRPNENYAREVMELFTLGEGQKYTEGDIREAARAFTGYKLDPATGRAALSPGAHDNGWKTIFGKKGTFDGDDVIKLLLLSEERVAINVAEKFWKEFVADTLDSKEVYKLASTFYHAKYDIRKLLRATLLTKQFWDADNRGTLFKSPAEYVVGTARLLQLPIDDPYGYAQLADHIGYSILDPPNVKGYPGSTSWISTETLLSRWEVADQMIGGKVGAGPDVGSMMGGAMAAAPAKPADDKDAKKDGKKEPATAKKEEPAGGRKEKSDEPLLSLLPKPWVADARAKGADGVTQAIMVLLPLAPIDEIAKDSGFDQALRQIVHDPSFNLK